MNRTERNAAGPGASAVQNSASDTIDLSVKLPICPGAVAASERDTIGKVGDDLFEASRNDLLDVRAGEWQSNSSSFQC